MKLHRRYCEIIDRPSKLALIYEYINLVFHGSELRLFFLRPRNRESIESDV